MYKITLKILYTIILLTLCCRTWAQANIDSTSLSLFVHEVEIKGIKKDKDYIQMPLATTSLTSYALKNNNIIGIRDISGVVPNLYISNYGTKLSSSVYIRGIGSRINSPSVGLYVDGIPYFEKSTFDFDFNGIKSIDILRGPQGTLYGRNSLGGVINVYTKSPLTFRGSEFELSGGSYGEYAVSASHYGGIGDKFGYGLSINYDHNDGYFENIHTNSKADKSDQGSARFRASYQLSDSLVMEITSTLDLVDQLGYPYSIYDTNSKTVSEVNYNAPSYYNRTMSISGVSLAYTHRNFKLTSQSSYLYVDDKQGVDQDFSPSDLYYAMQGQNQNTLSQELNLAGTVGRYQWLIGGFGFYQKQDNTVSVEYHQLNRESNEFYDVPTYGIAFYHQSIINNLLTKGLSFTLGIRYDFEKTEQDYKYDLITNGSKKRVKELNNNAKFDQFLPKLALQYTCRNSNIYATLSKGYKAGGFNITFSEDEEVSFKPEYTWNYELGYKQAFLNNHLHTEFALFYIDWKDQQVYQTLATGVGSMLRNAAHSTSKGVEFSISANPIKHLNLKANYGFTYAKFEDYVKNSTSDYSDNYLPFVPKHTIGVSGDYSLYFNGFINHILLGASYIGQGDIYWDDANAIKENYYGLLSSRVVLTSGRYNLELWGRNITDNQHFAFQFSSFGNNYVQLGSPRRFGATFRVNI